MDFFLTFSGSGSGLNQRFFIEALTGCAKLSDLFTWTVRVDRHGDFCIGQDVVLRSLRPPRRAAECFYLQ